MAEAEEFRHDHVPEAFFGAVVKDPDFRKQVLGAEDETALRQVLDQRGLHVHDEGLRQIKRMADYVNRDPSVLEKMPQPDQRVVAS